MNTHQTLPHKPLAGVRVIELGTSVAAPYGAWVLGTLGAEVIKVERPDGGDVARKWGEDFHGDTSLWFHSLNADKKSITVDLKNEQEVARLKRFISDQVDVVIQNHKPGSVDALGLDGTTLRQANPRLIYCNIGAFGRAGPLSERPGYDPLMQAFGGPMSITGHPGQPPVRVGFSVVDMGTGMWCAMGILAALNHRHLPGEGTIVDTALFETAVGWMQINASGPLNGGGIPQAYGSGVRGIAPYQAYPCADGYLLVCCGTDSLFAKLCDALERSQWIEDSRFVDNPARVENNAELNALLEEVLGTRTRSEWSALFDKAGIPNAPTQHMGEVMAHPQTEALGMIQQLTEGVRMTTVPVSFDGERPVNQSIAPALGADTEAILGPYSDSRSTTGND